MSDPWEEFTKSYTVHSESYTFTNILAENGIKSFADYSLEEARQILPGAFKSVIGDFPFEGEVQELVIPSTYVEDGIPATVYKPKNLATTPALVIYFHGGGLVLFDRTIFDPALKAIASGAGCIIVNVEYRLLMDKWKGPVPFDDGVVATKWVMENKEKLGGRPDSKVGVAGDSAGGQIAASVTNDVPGLDFQILIYGHLDMSLSQPSIEELANVPGLSKKDIQWFSNFISQELPDYLTNPRINPMVRTNVESSPTALIVQAQLDTLRDSGMVYAEKMRAAGVRTRIVVIEGVPHCFIILYGIFKTKCEEAYGHIVHFIKDFQT